MLSQLDARKAALPSRCRLQFSQGSQPSSSQFLNSAMNKCCLDSQSSQAAPMQEELDVLTSQLQLPSQNFVPGYCCEACLLLPLACVLQTAWIGEIRDRAMTLMAHANTSADNLIVPPR